MRPFQKATLNVTRALLVSRDRRYRSVVSMLLTRRGYRVLLVEGTDDIAQAVTREGAQVVVIDASPSFSEAARGATKLQALCPEVAVVVVRDDSEHGPDTQPAPGALHVASKWGTVDSLFEAIERARSSNLVRGGIDDGA